MKNNRTGNGVDAFVTECCKFRDHHAAVNPGTGSGVNNINSFILQFFELCLVGLFSGNNEYPAFPVGFQCTERYIQTATDDCNVRLCPQPLVNTPAMDICKYRLAVYRQDVLCLADGGLPVEAAAGYQQVGLTGQFLV